MYAATTASDHEFTGSGAKYWGESVAVHDLDGDGADEIIVGVPDQISNETSYVCIIKGPVAEDNLTEAIDALCQSGNVAANALRINPPSQDVYACSGGANEGTSCSGSGDDAPCFPVGFCQEKYLNWKAGFFGSGVAVGDVLCTGSLDLIVGDSGHSPYDGAGGADSQAGAVLVFGGLGSVINSFFGSEIATDEWIFLWGLRGEHANHRLGYPAVGDIDDDGEDDLILGARGFGPSEQGLAFVLGSAGPSVSNLCGVSGLHNNVLTGDLFKVNDGGIGSAYVTHSFTTLEHHRFGQGVHADDVNNDGKDDLLIGAPGRPGQGDGSAVYIEHGPISPGVYQFASFSPADVCIGCGSIDNDAFGYDLGTLDCDGDGFPELFVGAPGDDTAGFTDNGGVYSFRGSTYASDQSKSATTHFYRGMDSGDRFGRGIDTGNVFTGDSLDELVVGSPNPSASSGNVYVMNDFCNCPEPSESYCQQDGNPCTVARCNSGGVCAMFVESVGTVCRPEDGDCDVEEICDGVTTICPADDFLSGGTVCRESAGTCDIVEACSGTSAACPTDAFEPAATECRVSAGVCDPAESCTGSAAACPADALEPPTTECHSSAGACDPAENCTGSAATCPADVLEPGTTECRPSTGLCDPAENCTGSSTTCPTDALEPSTTVCRASVDECDEAENCDGANPICPADAWKPALTECRASQGVCDPAEVCTGTPAPCPADVLDPPSTLCRASTGECDTAENCTGASVDCPADQFAAESTACTDDGLYCTGVEECDGDGACVGDGDPCTGLGVCIVCDDVDDACVDTDADVDNICAPVDNCPDDFNPDQLDSDCGDPAFFLSGCCDGSCNDGDVPAGKIGCCPNLGQGGDVCDACAATRLHQNCDLGLSGGQSIGPAGGSFTVGGCLTIDIPAGALAQETSISVSTGEDDPVNPASGKPFIPNKLKRGTKSVHKTIWLPDEHEFDLPVTVTFCWNDADNDGGIDLGECEDAGACVEAPGTTCDQDADCTCGSCSHHKATPVNEDNLFLVRDGSKFDFGGFGGGAKKKCGDAEQQAGDPGEMCTAAAADCADAPGEDQASVALCCDEDANLWPFSTCNFSEMYVGEFLGKLIPGKGSLKTDCVNEFVVVNPFNRPPLDNKGLVNFKQTCTDGDVACDADGAADGKCTFRIGMCFNITDDRLVKKSSEDLLCIPSDVEVVRIKKPSPGSNRPAEVANGAVLRDAVVALDPGNATVSGSRQDTVTFAPPIGAAEACTEMGLIEVALRGADLDRNGKLNLGIRATTSPPVGLPKGSRDSDKLKLRCLPPGS
jgi:hypothetical protein